MKKGITIIILFFTVLSLNAQALIIPDIHGRTFWKEAVNKYPELPVIFLGDYLDPYESEGITHNDALTNFKEIIEFKKKSPERVTLLIGNHEIHYFDFFYKFSRKDTINQQSIQNLLYENLESFRIAASLRYEGKDYLFTHAGVLQTWWDKHFPDTAADVNTITDVLNAQIKDSTTLCTFIDKAIMDVSKLRGGEDEAGSCVWADAREFVNRKTFPDGVYQIFGHTKLGEKPIIQEHAADLDCSHAFILKTDGEIKIIE